MKLNKWKALLNIKTICCKGQIAADGSINFNEIDNLEYLKFVVGILVLAVCQCQ